jgi:hypothetical protein
MIKFVCPVGYIYQKKMPGNAAGCLYRKEITHFICWQIAYKTQGNVFELLCHYSELEEHYVC